MMHQTDDFSFDQVTKVEGHASLDIQVRNGKVKNVQFRIDENKRFYTQALRGKNALNLHQMTSRICGTCSIAHMTCCVEAVEKALGVVPSEQTKLLRSLSMHSLMIRDHALHLYFFCLPDIFGVDSILELAGKEPDLVHEALHVKEAGNLLSKTVAGRAVHPLYYRIGGFLKVPKREEIKKALKELRHSREYALRMIDVFLKCDFELNRDTTFIGLVSKNYNYTDGHIESSKGLCVPKQSYWNYLNRMVIPYSQATGFMFKGEEYMVSALSRMNLNKENLHKKTRKDARKALSVFPSKNIFHNNLAQAIEIVHSIDTAIDVLETRDFKQEKQSNVKPRAGEGIGVIEAPRGTLYYMVSVNDKGNVVWGNIITPTQQNQIKIERDIANYLPEILNLSRKEIRHEIEKVVRAYDPCLSCASHFLRLNWV